MGVVITVAVIAGIVWFAVKALRRDRDGARGRSAPAGEAPRLVIEGSGVAPSGQAAKDHPAERVKWERRRLLQDLTGEFLVDVGVSPNGRFLAGASGGYHGPGPLALVDMSSHRKLYVTKIFRPHDPAVSNDGVVVVQSWGTGEKLASDVWAFAPDGKSLWKFHLKANVATSGVSPGGARAFCTTYASPPHPEFSHRMFLLDAVTGEVLWSREWPGCPLRFEGEELVGDLTWGDGEAFALRFGKGGAVGQEGERALLLREVAVAGADRALVPRVREALQASPPRLKEAERLLGLVDLAGLEPVPRAKLLRLRGELSEARGEVAAAVDAYREALALYPRVGVKGRLQALEKLLL